MKQFKINQIEFTKRLASILKITKGKGYKNKHAKVQQVRILAAGEHLSLACADGENALDFTLKLSEPAIGAVDVLVHADELQKALKLRPKRNIKITESACEGFLSVSDCGSHGFDSHLVILPEHLAKGHRETLTSHTQRLECDESKILELKAPEFLQLLKQVQHAVSQDLTRYHLNGAFLDCSNQTLVSTDGHRLTAVKLAETLPELHRDDSPWISSTAIALALHAFKKTEGSVCLYKHGNMLHFSSPSKNLFCFCETLKYPNYQQLIPQSGKHAVTLDRARLTEALTGLLPHANKKSHGVTMTFDANGLHLTAQSPDAENTAPGSARLMPDKSSYDGSTAELKIRFNAQYWLDVLNSNPSDTITVMLQDQLSPALIKSGKSQQSVIMPMRI